MKKNFDIGSRFSTWEVIELVDSKRYKYLCRCVDCGNTKIFNKYYLIKGNYGLCKGCNPTINKDVKIIARHWNSELNGQPFTKLQDLDMGKNYWFICNKFHNFKSTIKNFSLDRCCSCKDNTSNSNDKILLYNSTLLAAKDLYKEVTNKEYYIVINDIKALILFREKDLDTSFRNYFSSESKYLEYLQEEKSIKEEYIKEGFKIYIIKVEKNYKENIDSVGKLMLEFSHSKNYFTTT